MIVGNCPDPKATALDDNHWTTIVDGGNSLFGRDQKGHVQTPTTTTITWRGPHTGVLNRSVSPSGSAVAIARAILAEHGLMETEDVIRLMHEHDITEIDALDAMQYLVLIGMAGIRDYSVLYHRESECVIEVCPQQRHAIFVRFGSFFRRIRSWLPER